jgi:cell division protein FtsZ
VADEDANIIFGAVIDESMGEEIRVTVIATGFDHKQAKAQEVKERIRVPELDVKPFSGDELDIPAFLRKKQ